MVAISLVLVSITIIRNVDRIIYLRPTLGKEHHIRQRRQILQSLSTGFLYLDADCDCGVVFA